MEIAAHGHGISRVHDGERRYSPGAHDGRPGTRCPGQHRHHLLGRCRHRVSRQGCGGARLPGTHRLLAADEALDEDSATPARISVMPAPWYQRGYSPRKSIDSSTVMPGMRCMVAPARAAPMRLTT